MMNNRKYGIFRQVIKPLTLFQIILIVLMLISMYIFTLYNIWNERKEASQQISDYTAEMFADYRCIGRIIDYLHNNYEKIELSYDEADADKKETELSQYIPGYISAKKITPEQFDTMSDDVRRLYAQVCYTRISLEMDKIKQNRDPLYLAAILYCDDMVFYIAEGVLENEARVSQGGILWELGMTEPYSLYSGEFPELDEMLGVDSESVFVPTILPNTDEHAVYTFSPVYGEDGGLAVVITTANGWIDFLIEGIGFTLIIFAIVAVLVMIQLWKTTRLLLNLIVRPIRKEQDILNKYIEDKQSEKVISELAEIKTNNEIQTFAENFSYMAAELDKYTKDLISATAEKERMAKLVLGDGPYYKFNLERSYKDSDKANIDSMLKRIEELDNRIFGEDYPYDDYREGYEHNLKSYMESYAQLPEPGPMEPWPGSFDAEHMSLADENNNWIMIDVGEFYFHDSIGNSAFAFDAKRMPETDEERQAADAASAVFSALSDTPFRVSGIVGDNDGFNALYAGVAQRPVEQYSVRLTPVFSGIPAYPYSSYHGSDTGRQAAGVSSDDYDDPVRPMSADALVENGKVIALSWYNVYDVVGTENENVTLLPFDKILEKFKKQVYYSIYFDPPEDGDPEATMVMVVEHIRLSYMRVKKPDSDECWLLPVWDFLGYDYNPAYAHTERDLRGTKSWFSNQSLLTINAIDGSIIDRDKGY